MSTASSVLSYLLGSAPVIYVVLLLSVALLGSLQKRRLAQSELEDVKRQLDVKAVELASALEEVRLLKLDCGKCAIRKGGAYRGRAR